MPSWPARLLSNTPTSLGSSAPHPSSPPHYSNTDKHRRHAQSSMFPNSGPSSSRPIPNVGPAPESSRRVHSRSNSHPFPSLFGGGKKDNKAAARFDALESTDDEITNYVGLPQAGSPSKTTNHHRRGTPSGDLITGKCMTCDSTVRWPRNLKVFRCSVCLTINDLEPNLEGPKDVASSKSKGSSGQHIHRKRKNYFSQLIYLPSQLIVSQHFQFLSRELRPSSIDASFRIFRANLKNPNPHPLRRIT